MNILEKIIDPAKSVEPSLIRGELPSAREAYKRCFALAWPSALEAVLVSLVSSVDTMMVGSLGPGAISAVGITTQPKFLLMALIISLNVGVTAVVARRKGEGDFQGASRTLKQALLICMAFSALMTSLALILPRELLTLAGAQADFIEDGIAYFRIIMCGQFFNCIGMTINAAQRGFGNTKVSMRSNIAANLVNILFNYFLINGNCGFPKLGVSGAAIATALGGLVAFSMALLSVLKHHNNVLTILGHEKWSFDRRTVSSVGKVGSSAAVEQVFMRFGFFVYALMVASLGTVPFATHQICMHILNLSFAFSDGFSIASTSLVGQGLGAKRPDLAMIYGKAGQRFAMFIGILLSLMFILLRRQIISLFSQEAAIIDMGAAIMFIIAAIALVQTSQVVISGCLRGAGDSKYVARTSFISIAIIRTAVSWLLCYPVGLGLIGAWLGIFLDQSSRLLLNFIRFKSGKWAKIEL